MGGSKHRSKGDRVEREIVELHEDIGIHAERYPLSGASRFRGTGHDLDVYAKDAAPPLRAEVKARKEGSGFTMLEKWLGDYDLLFLKRNHKTPLVVLPWHIYARLMGDEDKQHPEGRSTPPERTSTKPVQQGLPGQFDMFLSDQERQNADG